jgi:hypothetical protein
VSRFDVGVFIEARHLVGVDPKLRAPGELIERVQIASTQLCLGSGLSHRVLVADCADPEAPTIADDFSIAEGFRVRHHPTAGTDASTVLSAEVFEAVHSKEGLRTVVIVGAIEPYRALVDALHRMGRAIIVMSSDAADEGAIYWLIRLPLDPAPLHELAFQAMEKLRRDGIEITAKSLGMRLKEMQPGFKPARYGYRSMQEFAQVVAGLKPVAAGVGATRARPGRRPPA